MGENELEQNEPEPVDGLVEDLEVKDGAEDVVGGGGGLAGTAVHPNGPGG